jgi:hypothetical protein
LYDVQIGGMMLDFIVRQISNGFIMTLYPGSIEIYYKTKEELNEKVADIIKANE